MYKFFFIFLIFGMIFTDLPFFSSYTVTHSLMFIISPIIFVTILIIKNFKLDIKRSFLVKIFLFYTIFTLITSLLLLLVYLLFKGDFAVYNKNLIVKLLEAFFSVTFLSFTVVFNLNFLLQRMNLNFFKKAIYVVFLFLTISAFLEFFNQGIFSFLHATHYTYDRLRLFTSEPSQATLLYFIFASLAFFLYRKKIMRIFIFLISFIVLLLVASKGFFISFLIASVFIFGKYFKNKKFSLLMLILVGLSSYVFYNFALPALYVDIEHFTSFSTRFSCMISVLLILVFFPFGTGYGTYLYFYPDILKKSFNIANQIFLHIFSLPLSYLEINSMITTGKDLGAKSTIPDAVLYNGWIGLLFFVIIFLKFISRIKSLALPKTDKIILEFIIYTIFIQLLIGSESVLLYCIWLPLIFIENLNKLEENCR